eukprot:jgi/Chlat1/2755/Chrsp187S02941
MLARLFAASAGLRRRVWRGQGGVWLLASSVVSEACGTLPALSSRSSLSHMASAPTAGLTSGIVSPRSGVARKEPAASAGRQATSPVRASAASAHLGRSSSNELAMAPATVPHANGMPVTATATEAVKVEEKPQPIFLKDYKFPPYHTTAVDLEFNLDEEFTTVRARLTVEPSSKGAAEPLVLDGVDQKLLSAMVNGKQLAASDYEVTPKHFRLLQPPQETFVLETVTQIQPQLNTSLEGLYKSSGNFCTQCEAEGFRKITYFQDRPDIMAKFTTRIVGDKSKYPVLLSNGNLVDSGDLEDGKHFCVWEDPFVKPSYLFALVAGQLSHIQDKFVTMSGREVVLRIYVQEHNIKKCDYAMVSLKHSMKWDEDVFGREYDLDLFNIVAVDDFNMGAMENKSLNIFNSKLVLATPDTATDMDYSNIEGVVAHEYFHNWTGNRVTCRDWFQLSLKEGLTEFSADMNSRAVKRIADVIRLRISQFSQDAGPMAHPVRPESYIKMDNFYTVTVYEKGAEVVRMYQTLLGTDGFRKGMDLYFERHDGQAVTCDDFRAAMADANGVDLEHFKLWYSQAGTPELTVTTSYDADKQTYTLQAVPPTAGQPSKLPMLVPFAVGLLGPDGADMPLTALVDNQTGERVSLQGKDGSSPTTTVLRVDKAEQTFTFADVQSKPVPSFLRNFSAPINLKVDLSDDELIFLASNDSDQWEAGQRLARKVMLALLDKQSAGEQMVLDSSFVNAYRSLLGIQSLDKAFVSTAMVLPSVTEISEMLPVADPVAIHSVRKFVVKTLAKELRSELRQTVEANSSDEAYKPDTLSKARRSLKNTAFGYLASLNEPEITNLACKAFRTATNMTDEIAALASVAMNDTPERDQVLDEFYQKWQKDMLVVNKWLGLQASSDIPGNVMRVKALMNHPAFDIRNPNKVYSLIGGFCASPVNFHAEDGSGYEFLADVVLQLDSLNGQVASRMVSAFTRWRKYGPKRQEQMKAQLQRIMGKQGLTDNVYEIVSKSLAP